MNKYLVSALIILSFLSFCAFTFITKNLKTVLDIEAPDIFKIDLNNNKIFDDNERVCLENSDTFRSDSIAPEFAQNLNIQDIIKMHYLAEEFAKNTLFLKQVKVKFTGNSNHDCKFAEIFQDNKKYSDKLVEAGFAKINNKFNEQAYKSNIEKAEKLNLVILNHKSYKYHTLDCEYGRMSHDYTIVPKKQLPHDAVPCKFCHTNKNKPSASSKYIPNTTIKSGEITLILPDFTLHTKPDTNCTTNACKTLVNQINKATKSIDIAIYGYGNVNKVYQALTNAKHRNVKIRLVYDRYTSPDKEYYPDTKMITDIADESRSDFIPGQPANTDKLMHNKFIIFDNKTVFTGSMNLSPTDLSDFNANTIVIINSPEIAQVYTKEFEQMLSGNFHNNKRKVNPNNLYKLNNTIIEIMFLPYDKASNNIIKIIDKANHYIYIPAFLITHESISNALIRAKKRGIDIKVILDAANVNTNHTKHNKLRQNGIQLKTENYAGKMHSKSMIIDDKYLIAGSMNFSNSGENKNDENCLIIQDEKLAKQYKDFFVYLWNKIPDKWLKLNARAEGTDSVGSCSDGIDNDFDGKIDKDDNSCVSNLK